jgi:hypothetical protein
MSKFNPALAGIALSMLSKLNDFEKEAFVPMDPASQQQAAAQQQPQQGAPQDPSQGGAPPSPAGGGGDPAAAGGGGGSPQIQGTNGLSLDDIRGTIRQEVEAANEKPKKQSVDERLTALEGAFLRLLQHLGMIEKQETDLDAGLPQDADKMQDEAQAAQGGGDPMGGAAMPPDAGGGAGLMGPGTTGQPSGMDMGGGGMPPMEGAPKMANLNNPYAGLATALARLRDKV